MSNGESAESRIEAVLSRLDAATDSIKRKPVQGSLGIGIGSDQAEDVETLRNENQSLRHELLELSAAYNSLKEATMRVSTRLDDTIEDIGELLEN